MQEAIGLGNERLEPH